MRGGQEVDDVEIDAAGGPIVGVVNDNVHHFGSRIGDVVKVDRDVVAGPTCAFGAAAQLPGCRVQDIMSVGTKAGGPGAAVVVEVAAGSMKTGFCLCQALQRQVTEEESVQEARPLHPVPRQRRTATVHWGSVHGRRSREPVTTSMVVRSSQKSATPRARLRSLMSLTHCFFFVW